MGLMNPDMYTALKLPNPNPESKRFKRQAVTSTRRFGFWLDPDVHSTRENGTQSEQTQGLKNVRPWK